MPITSNKRIKAQHQNISTILAFALLPLSGFATDIYIPSLPGMGASLHVSSIQVQLTLSLFLISYGLSQLFIGSILDSFGRYRLSLIALVIFVCSNIIIAQTHSLFVIYLMRIVHGVTVAAIVVAKRAYFVDLFTGDKLKHYLSMFTIIWSTGPIVAPFIGGYLQHVFGWQANFYFLGGIAAILAVLEFIFSGETLKHTTAFKLKNIAGIYFEMITTASFTLGLMMLGLGYSMVMLYNMAGPFIVEHQLGLTPVVAGYCSLILGIAWMIGGFIGKATIELPFNKRMLINVGLQAAFAVIMILSLGFLVNLYTLVFFAFMIHVGAGFTYNNYFTYCLRKFPKNAGIAGGLTGGVVYVMVSFLTYGIISIFPAKDERNLSFGYLILILLSGLVMYVVWRLNARKEVEVA